MDPIHTTKLEDRRGILHLRIYYLTLAMTETTQDTRGAAKASDGLRVETVHLIPGTPTSFTLRASFSSFSSVMLDSREGGRDSKQNSDARVVASHFLQLEARS